MARYNFTTITPDEALAYNGSTDTLGFSSSVATSLRVLIDDTHVTISSLTFENEHTAVFGLGMLGETDFTFTFGSSNLVIGTSASEQISTTFFGSAIFAGDGNDTLVGLGGTDVLDGGAGTDFLTPGSLDTVVFDPGQSLVAAPDIVTTWRTGVTLEFSGLSGKTGLYVETSAASLADAKTAANQQIAAGAADYVAVQVGSVVYLFADDKNDNGVADDMVQLNGATLAQISAGNVAHAAQGVDPLSPDLPAVTGAIGRFTGNMDQVHLSHLLGQGILEAIPTHLNIFGPGAGLGLLGTGFTYDANEQLLDGTVTHIDLTDNDPGTGFTVFSGSLDGVSLSAAPFAGWVATDATATAFATALAGSDTIEGSSGADLIRGLQGNDELIGHGGQDTLYGGPGDDTLYAVFLPGQGGFSVAGSTYLRGDEGDDSITGGAGFDDINGNMGNDSASGGAGDDWVVGGKDNDFLSGDTGNDIVWGNLGNDTCDGGAGDDQCRGGQGDDNVAGGAGADFVSGDRGNDTITGGAGADIFHTSQDAGIDRVLDFHLAEGDRVQLDPGTIFNVIQVGADTVIDMGGGNQMILVGVQMTTLTPGWIFGA